MQHPTNTNPIYQADRFTFTDTQSSSLQIIFLPQTKGNLKIPQLDYQSPEGKFTYQGNEIVQQQSNLGLLISIPLKTNTDAGELNFALILPFINMNGQKRQDFETVAIAATKSQKIVANCTRCEFTYKMLTLKGVAEKLSVVASGFVPSSARLKARQLPATAWQNNGFDLIDFQRF